MDLDVYVGMKYNVDIVAISIDSACLLLGRGMVITGTVIRMCCILYIGSVYLLLSLWQEEAWSEELWSGLLNTLEACCINISVLSLYVYLLLVLW